MEEKRTGQSLWTVVLFAVLVPVLFVAALKAAGWTLEKLGCTGDTATLIAELAIAIVFFAFFRKTVLCGERRPLAVPRVLFGFLVLGLPFLADAAGCMIDAPLKSGAGEIALAIGAGLAVGIAEEVVFRGVVFNRLGETLSDRKNGALIAALLSSAAFALLHLMNLTTQPLAATLMQVCFAFAAGVCFAAIYLVSGTLLVPILLHAIVDACHFLPVTDATAEATAVNPLLLGLSTLVLLEGVALLLMQKHRREHAKNGG